MPRGHLAICDSRPNSELYGSFSPSKIGPVLWSNRDLIFPLPEFSPRSLPPDVGPSVMRFVSCWCVNMLLSPGCSTWDFYVCQRHVDTRFWIAILLHVDHHALEDLTPHKVHSSSRVIGHLSQDPLRSWHFHGPAWVNARAGAANGLFLTCT